MHFYKSWNRPYPGRKQPSLFFGSSWPRFEQPQAVFVQSQLGLLNVALLSAPVLDKVSPLDISFDENFPSNAKLLPLNLLTSLLQDHLNGFPFRAIVATNASVRKEEASVGIFLPV